MEELYNQLKSRFGKLAFNLIHSEMIEITFPKAKEPVIIQAGTIPGRYLVSYPALQNTHSGKKETYTTLDNIMLGGIIFIIKQVSRNGKVMPEF